MLLIAVPATFYISTSQHIIFRTRKNGNGSPISEGPTLAVYNISRPLQESGTFYRYCSTIFLGHNLSSIYEQQAGLPTLPFELLAQLLDCQIPISDRQTASRKPVFSRVVKHYGISLQSASLQEILQTCQHFGPNSRSLFTTTSLGVLLASQIFRLDQWTLISIIAYICSTSSLWSLARHCKTLDYLPANTSGSLLTGTLSCRTSCLTTLKSNILYLQTSSLS